MCSIGEETLIFVRFSEGTDLITTACTDGCIGHGCREPGGGVAGEEAAACRRRIQAERYTQRVSAPDEHRDARGRPGTNLGVASTRFRDAEAVGWVSGAAHGRRRSRARRQRDGELRREVAGGRRGPHLRPRRSQLGRQRVSAQRGRRRGGDGRRGRHRHVQGVGAAVAGLPRHVGVTRVRGRREAEADQVRRERAALLPEGSGPESHRVESSGAPSRTAGHGQDDAVQGPGAAARDSVPGHISHRGPRRG